MIGWAVHVSRAVRGIAQLVGQGGAGRRAVRMRRGYLAIRAANQFR